MVHGFPIDRRCVVTCAVAVLLSAPPAAGVDFAHEVVPLLKKHCGECHLGDARQGGFSMNTREDLLAGGDSGTPGFVAGKPAESEIISRITSTDPDNRMPADGDPLQPDEVALLRRWIDEKAPWEPGFAFQRSTWEPQLRLREVALPPAHDGRTNLVDRIVDAYWTQHGVRRPPRCDDHTFIRRVSLDLVGLLPDPERVAAFVHDPSPGKRTTLVRELLADRIAYAEHWMTFWNDLLRNDYTGTGFITGGRRQITTWLHRSLAENKPFDLFVRELIAPTEETRGFIDGIVWRGTVNASQTVPIQFAQNVGQTFLGINLKCASCHDSFVDRWTLAQTYDLAAISSATPLELHRCDKATGVTATPRWLFPDIGQIDPAAAPADRLAQLAAVMTKPENGWLSRNLVNRLWHRLVGRGLVHPVDSLRLPPWSEDLLDVLATDLVTSGWDTKHVLETICTSETYGAMTQPTAAQPPGAAYLFRGPLPRRMTAEQFTDAIWALTGTAPAKPVADVMRFEPPPDTAERIAPTATWVWSNDLAASPPGERLTFRRSFDLPADTVHAVLVCAADNEATVFMNGKSVATCTDWTEPVLAQVASSLRKGGNEILVMTANGAAGGPAALRVELRVRLIDGSMQTIASDASWQWTSATPDGKGRFRKGREPSDWAPAAVVKAQGTWHAGSTGFARQLIHAAAPATLPMVRAVLVKNTALMAALGRPNRDQVVTSRPGELTTLEAIQLANEQGLADEFFRGGAAILRQRGPSADAILSWMFRAALSRPPSPDEAAAARNLLGDAPTPESVADCLWAVVMLPEFQLIR